MMQQCNDSHFYSPLIHEPFLCQKVLDIRSTISSQNWPELSAFGMAASCLSLQPAGAAKLAGAAAALLCFALLAGGAELAGALLSWAGGGFALLLSYGSHLSSDHYRKIGWISLKFQELKYFGILADQHVWLLSVGVYAFHCFHDFFNLILPFGNLAFDTYGLRNTKAWSKNPKILSYVWTLFHKYKYKYKYFINTNTNTNIATGEMSPVITSLTIMTFITR